MEAAVEHGGQVGGSDTAIAVSVKLCEGLVNGSLTLLVGASTDSDKELVVVDEAVFVGVEALDKNFTFALADGDSEVLDAPVEFLLVELAVSVVVNDAECTAHAANGLGSASGESSAYLGNNLMIVVLW